MWNTDVVTRTTDSWNVVWDADSPYKGKVTAYDSPIYIADAAVYLKATQPDLGIENPYELDEDAVRGRGRPAQAADGRSSASTGRDAAKQISAFTSGDSVVGTTWQVPVNLLDGRQACRSRRHCPRRARPGWSDTWMISSKAQEPELHVPLDGLHHQPGGERAGGGVVRRGARRTRRRASSRRTRSTARSSTPTTRSTSSRSTTGRRRTKDCGDDRGEVCKDYSEMGDRPGRRSRA